MTKHIWSFLLKLSLAFYFIYPNINKFTFTEKSLDQNSIFSCANNYIPQIISNNIWYGFLIALGLLILFWPRPIFPLIISLIILSLTLYINFNLNNFGVNSILLLTLILISISLIIYYAFHKRLRD